MTCTKSHSFPFFLPMVLFCPWLSRIDLSAVDSEAGSCSEAASLSTWHRSPHFTAFYPHFISIKNACILPHFIFGITACGDPALLC